MKLKTIAGILAASTLFFASCDDSTSGIGASLIDNMDKLNIQTDTFEVTTRSIAADSVLNRSTTGYIGKVKDPQTGAYVTGDFMTQFHLTEGYSLPDKDSIRSLDSEGNIVADSVDIRLYFEEHFGDSLATMKLTAYEMGKPMEENSIYYTNFDPIKEGYIRQDGIKKDKVYALYDYNISDSLRTSSDFMPYIRIKLNEPYTDAEGNTYNNYGTYILRKYYKNPKDFKDAYAFIHNVVPGFFFKTKSGLGSMGYITASQLNVFYRYNTLINSTTTSSTDTSYVKTVKYYTSFPGTEEVLQTTTISNSKNTMKRLVDVDTCTYIKSPAGIFTEMTLPIDQILSGHERDTLNTAKVSLARINNATHDENNLDIPGTLLMIPKSDMYSFFENSRIVDYKTSFVASYNSSYNNYTFNNISNLVKNIAQTADRSNPDWNKVVIIPVTITYNTNSSSSEMVKVTHTMALTSTRLIGGDNNPYGPIKLSVIYAKFNETK